VKFRSTEKTLGPMHNSMAVLFEPRVSSKITAADIAKGIWEPVDPSLKVTIC
jgi:hypothetical protein